ncbi:MAG: histone deacetylase [Planctomycetota bacterium]
MARTGFYTSPAFARHDTGPGHPEREARVRAIERRVADTGLRAELCVRAAEEIEVAALASVHDAEYVSAVERAIAAGARVLDEGDTKVSSESWRAARTAAGAALQAVDAVMAGELDNAFVAARPPGHHAERSFAMGFCVFNNVALAAAHLRAQHGLERVAIVDWDVHHGNGTQHIFESDPSVFFASLHQWPLYPGTGAPSERGVGAGEGATLNAPQAPGAGDREWLDAFDTLVLPALERFRPQFVLVSAGFDAHRDDPLAQTNLTEHAFERMSTGLLDLARRHAHGRLVSLLEGGYDLEALARSACAHLGALRSA